MGLQRDRFLVYVTPPNPTGDVQTPDNGIPLELEATVTHQDMLRGEQVMLQQAGMNLQHGLMLTTAWAWASLMRQGDYAGAWQQFRDQDCQGVEKLDPVEVDPTQPGTGDDSP